VIYIKKLLFITLLIIISLIIISNLAYKKNSAQKIKTSESEKFTESLEELIYIDEVELIYQINSITCYLGVNDSFDKSHLNNILQIAREFTTIENMVEIRKKYSESSQPPSEFTIEIYYGSIKKDNIPNYRLRTSYSNPIHTEIYDYKIWDIFKDDKLIDLDNQENEK
jgi:hypothetical protein